MCLVILVALVPLPTAFVERAYSERAYPAFQHQLTSWTNLTTVAVADVVIGLTLLAVLLIVLRRLRAGGSPRRKFVVILLDVVGVAAFVYVIFLAFWGFNYQRQPLTERVDFDGRRVTPERIEQLTIEGVEALNALYREAHATAWAEWEELPPKLSMAFSRTEQLLGGAGTTRLGLPKVSVAAPYFRWAAVDGVTMPFTLEVLVNPDALPVERPMVAAHEWAHLAGFAQEAEASFVGALACLSADDQSRYSAWLFVMPQLASALPTENRERAFKQLDEGPRSDLRAIAERLRQSSPRVRAVAWNLYDGYLKANRVTEGVANYDLVVRLFAGTRGHLESSK